MSRLKKHLLPVAVMAVAVMGLAACSSKAESGGTNTADSSTSSSGSSAEGSADGTDSPPAESVPLRVWSGNATPITADFNPFHVDNALHATFGAIYEPLFFFNELSSDAPTGLIGESYEYSADGKTITIKIKPDQVWSDGEPLTSGDVVFTWGYANNKTDKLLSAEAPDATTVVLTYSEPQFTSESTLLGGTYIIPKHVWEAIGDGWNDTTNENPVGSGPYIVSATSDASYTTVANPKFRDGPPAVNEVIYVGLDSNQSSEDMLKTGQLDWVGQFMPDPTVVTGSGNYATMNNQLDPTTIMSCVNVDLGCKGPQTDPAVRQALSLAIDRGGIADKAFAGLTAPGDPAMLLLPRDENWLSDPALGSVPDEPDAAGAGKILEAAGYVKDGEFYAKDGQRLSIDLFSPDGWTDYNDTAKLISESAAKAGIEVRYRTVSENDYWDPMGTGDFQMVLQGITQSLVPDPFSVYHDFYSTERTIAVGDWPNGSNYARYSNAEVDAAVKQAGATDDEALKKEAYAVIQQNIARDLPYIPIVTNASQAFYNVKNFTGWPTEDNLYANPLPYRAVASAVVLTHLKPVN